MVILCILLLALLMALATTIVCLVFKPKWAWLNRVMLAMIALSIAMGCVTLIADSVCGHQLDGLRDEYDNINLYYNTIALCENEYVRFDFYERVNDYNAEYKKIQENAENIWLSAFFPKGWDEEITPIEFYLHGDTPYDG